LVEETQAQEEAEEQAAKEALGHNKYARSQAEADEQAKLARVQKTKQALEKYKKRESDLLEGLVGLLGPVVVDKESSDGGEDSKTSDDHDAPRSASSPQVVRITRDQLGAGKRVVTISDTSGKSMEDTIVLTQDLSLLESKMAINAQAKAFPGDAENDVAQPSQPQERSIYGIIKLFITNVHHCTILVKCKIISGTLELHNCSHVKVIVTSDATVATIQADLSNNVQIEFRDAPSGRNVDPRRHKLYWGDDRDDRIFHAGVTDMTVRLIRDDVVESELTADYLRDGATTIGNASPEEYQFVTSCLNGALVTEQVVRSGQTTGSNVRAMTPREVDDEKKRRERAAELALAMAEDMIQIKDKDGNVLAKKVPVEPPIAAAADNVDDAVAEVYGGMTAVEIKEIVAECEQNKVRGNEAFGAGEYGQAILLYSLALDKADELPDDGATSNKLFPRDLLYSNRAACFLKLGQHDKALDDANRALTCNHDNVKANFRKGLALHALGRYREALPVLAQAAKIEPKNKQIQQALQFCEVRLQQELRKLHE